LYNLPKRKRGEEGMRMRKNRVKRSTEILIDGEAMSEERGSHRLNFFT
jgi:hypothetical protein